MEGKIRRKLPGGKLKNVRVNAREVRVIEGLSYRDSTVVTNTDFNSSLSDVGQLKYISNYMFTFSFAFICKKSN